MSQTVTAAYDSIDKATNAFHELVAEGFVREELFLDTTSSQVRVIVPDPTRKQAEDILKRHEPEEIWAKPFPAE